MKQDKFPIEDIQLIKDWLKPELANVYFSFLKYNVKWTDKLRNGNGAGVKIKRKMAYVGEGEFYRYNGLEMDTSEWNYVLSDIQGKLNFANRNFKYSGEVYFNSVLLNLYETCKDEIRWHSDKESQLGDNPIIACVNLGYGRNFHFLRKEDGLKQSYWVDHGDLLIMGSDCQKKYLHAILKEPTVGPRISLTFREVL